MNGLAEDDPYNVRYLKTYASLYVDGEDFRDDSEGWGFHRLISAGFFMPEDVASPIRLSSLRRSLQAAVDDGNGGSGTYGYIDLRSDVSLLVSTAASDEFDSKYSPPHDVTIDLVDGRLLGRVDVLLTSEDWSVQTVTQAACPLLSEFNTTIVDCGEYGEGAYAGNPWPWAVRFEINPRGKTVGDVLSLGLAVRDLLLAMDRGDLDAAAAWAMVLSGRVTALHGQPESHWLEAKTFGWDLSSDAGKIELAQDVARFANGDNDGLMLVGLASRKEDGAEILIRGPRQSFQAKDVQRHHQVIDERVYPPIQGLRIEVVSSGHSSDLLAFWVPSQPDELKPFLVHGVVIGAKVEGAFMSVVRRRGEHSITDSPKALHAQIAAGRALLRRGYSMVKDEAKMDG